MSVPSLGFGPPYAYGPHPQANGGAAGSHRKQDDERTSPQAESERSDLVVTSTFVVPTTTAARDSNDPTDDTNQLDLRKTTTAPPPVVHAEPSFSSQGHLAQAPSRGTKRRGSEDEDDSSDDRERQGKKVRLSTSEDEPATCSDVALDQQQMQRSTALPWSIVERQEVEHCVPADPVAAPQPAPSAPLIRSSYPSYS